VRAQRDLADDLPLRRVDDRERAAAETDVRAFRRGIEADVVGVVADLHARDPFERSGVHDVEHPAAAVRDEDPALRGEEEHALRLGESLDALQPLVRVEIDDLERSVLERRDEEPAAPEVDRKVVHPAVDTGQLDRGLEGQADLGGRRGGLCEEQRGGREHHGDSPGRRRERI